jgi:hypothetical protein
MTTTKLSLSNPENSHLFGTLYEQRYLDLLDSRIDNKPAEYLVFVTFGITIISYFMYPAVGWIMLILLVISVIVIRLTTKYCDRLSAERIEMLDEIGSSLGIIKDHPIPKGSSMSELIIRHVRGERVSLIGSNIRVSFFECTTCYIGERCGGGWEFFIEDKKGCKPVIGAELQRLVKLTESIL